MTLISGSPAQTSVGAPRFGGGAALKLESVAQELEGLTLRDAKHTLRKLGFKRAGENFQGPSGLQAHVDMTHGDHLDLTHRGDKRRVPVDFSIRFE